jgi:hypothetical protein
VAAFIVATAVFVDAEDLEGLGDVVERHEHSDRFSVCVGETKVAENTGAVSSCTR